MTARRAGLVLALAFALIAAGVTLFIMVGNGSRGGGPNSVAATPGGIGQPPPTPAPPAKEQESGQGRWQIASKDDPTKLAGELSWTALEPLPERGRSLITQPRAWLYLKGGRTAYVQAERGRVYRPNPAGSIESGRFEGAVVARVYEEKAGGGKVDIERDRPSLLIYTDSLNFDTIKGEASTPDRVMVSTADVEFAGTGLLLVLNEVHGQLELLEIARDCVARYAGKGAERDEERVAEQSGAPATAPGAPAGGPSEPAGPAVAAAGGGEAAVTTVPEVRENLYRAEFRGDVKLVQGARNLNADMLEIWVRLLDNKLPPGAIAWGKKDAAGPEKAAAADAPATGAPDGAAAPSSPSSPAAPAVASGAPAAPAGAGSQPGRSIAAPETNEDIVLTWAGPLVVRPLDVTPPELEHGNHASLRFTADRRGAVTFEDPELGSGRCAWIGYAATLRDVTLAGPGPTSVVATMRDGKKATVGRYEVNLGTGIAHIPGGGVFEDGPRRIVWSDQADMVFSVKDGSIGDALREASFTGQASARDATSTISGDFLKASFVEPAAKKMLISRLVVDGKVNAEGGDAGRLRADSLNLAFASSADGTDAVPSVLTAKGSVVASDKGRTLSSEFLEAGLGRGEDGKRIVVTDAMARGAVEFAEPERQLGATADEAVIDALQRTVVLTGEQATAASGPSTITGRRIELDDSRGELRVAGAGRFVHLGKDQPARVRGPEDSGERAFTGRVEATWSDSMQFTDATGVIECLGDVAAISGEGTGNVHVVRGERLWLELTPGTAVASGAGRDAGSAAPKRSAERQLVRAEVWGGEGADNEPALAEQRKYAAAAADGGAEAVEGGDGERRLEQFLRVTGDHIVYEAAKGVVTVPGAGKAAVFDGKTAPTKTAAAVGDVAAGAGGATDGGTRGGGGGGGGVAQDARGAALFTWRGSMGFDLGTGVLDMRRAVTMVHRSLKDDAMTTLECERLEATLGARGAAAGSTAAPPPPAGGLAGAEGAELKRAVATGAVYAASGTMKLMADRLVLDAATRVCEATASEDNRITIFDEAKGTAVTARTMLWDMKTDRVEVKEPSPVVIPK